MLSAQNNFQVIDFKGKYTIGFKKDITGEYLPIEYFDTNDFSEKKKIKLIEELLFFEGDERLCGRKIKCYNLAAVELDTGYDEYYSIQVQALFFINQFFFEAPFNYSPYPVLKNKNWGKSSIKGTTIDLAFKQYRKWFKKIKKKGIAKAKKRDLTPLKNAREKVRWL